MTRAMGFVFVVGLCLSMLSCEPAQEGSESETLTNESTDSSAEATFANLREARFEQPLPRELQLAVLTAVETDEGFVVELVDPFLTNADAGTGLVTTYFLYGDSTDSDRRFSESAEQLEEDGARPVTLDTAKETICLIDREGARCVTGTADYLLETTYLPGEDTHDMRVVMEEVIDAVIAHYEANL